MLEVYTSQYGLTDPDRLDITVKTGNKAFSPTWDMVWGLKNGNLSESEYTKKYLELMISSQEKYPEEWEKLLARKRVVLVCFCKSGVFCHRHVLAELLTTMGAKVLGEIDLKSKKEIENKSNQNSQIRLF